VAERRASPAEHVEPKRLFRWPEAGRVGRLIPKERLYSEASVTSTIRQRFVDEVQHVRWAYKLGEESVRLPGSAIVPEIQVFEVELKRGDLSDSVLTSIDKSVPSPIIFELHRVRSGRSEVRLAGSRKMPTPGGPKLSDYFRGDWMPSDAERMALPPALDLAGLYAQLLTALMPLPARPGEELSVVIDRMTRARKLGRAISALDKRMRIEPQFNRRVELRRDLHARQAELDELTNDNAPTAEDATWRN
jgi:hypothetical protein